LVHFNLAALIALASRPDGRATFAELDRQVKLDAERADPWQLERLSTLGDINVVELGLVALDGDEVCITDAGRSLLGAAAVADAVESTTSRSYAAPIVPVGSEEGSDAAMSVRMATVHAPLPEPKPFLPRAGSGARPTALRPPRRNALVQALASRIEQGVRIWRRHLERENPRLTVSATRASVGPAIFALLTLLVIMVCVGAIAALIQIKSLKTEIAVLQKEVVPLRDQLHKFEQAEASKGQPVKQDEERKASSSENPHPAKLTLSQDQIQLIREYIKPAPTAGATAPPVNVGDVYNGSSIPLPSSLTDKLPNLVGARFAIRNGFIIIMRAGSHNADAVLGVK
jgi:hypothetical protein